MNLPTLWTEIEADLEWREREIRFLQNQLTELEEESERTIFRRAIVVLLYAHLEGFCKFSFELYVRAVNREGITCRDANFAIAAATLADAFAALRDPTKKAPEFRNLLPDDSALHRFARDREFVERIQEIEGLVVNIPSHVVETGSNLSPKILRKLLFRLGFESDQLSHLDGELNMLLNFRNGIAHGQFKAGLDEKQFQTVRNTAFHVMSVVKGDVMRSLHQRAFLKTA